MIYNNENAQHVKNHNGSMRILEYLECYKDGCIFDDIFYDLSKYIPNLTMAYVLSILEILKEEKYITCSKREGFHYFNISETGIEFLSIEKEKSERKKSKKNTSSNSDDFQTVGKLIQTSEDFIKSLESIFEDRKKDIILSNQKDIAEKNQLKEEIKSQLKGMSFFDFKIKRAKKDELKSLKHEIIIIKSKKHINDLVNAEKYKLDKIKNDYISEIDLFLDNRCRVPLKQQYDMHKQLQIKYIQNKDIEKVILEYLYASGARTVYDLSSYCSETLYDCTPRYIMGIIKTLLEKNLLSRCKEYGMTLFHVTDDFIEIKNKEFETMLLKHLYVSGRKSAKELAEYFKAILPNCNYLYIKSIITPMKQRGIIVRTEEKGVEFYQIEQYIEYKRKHTWPYVQGIEIEKTPFSKWYFLKDDLIFENEKIPNIPKI